MSKTRAVAFTLVLAGGCAATFFLWPYRMLAKAHGEKNIADRVAEFGAAVDARLAPLFREKGVAYPPQQIVFLGFKKERQLEVLAADADGKLKFIRAYPILAASGKAGPKLQQGDGQVPEGFYKIESLNPNSRFHLSLRVNYPNDSDHAHAADEGRTDLGGDIMIHGSFVSVGCLAMGDSAAEDLFVLAAKTGVKNIRVILSPVDFRNGATVETNDAQPQWTRELYAQIKIELAKFPKPQ
jgi:hypothetical protein